MRHRSHQRPLIRELSSHPIGHAPQRASDLTDFIAISLMEFLPGPKLASTQLPGHSREL